ncbi:hypothetical protein RRG08_037335 [Elysia crispata]|uniref:Uncharacterized protein n=1 Tax=Elysia crispata TaxID=231223 RepID=A0AAE1AFS2_9GAST|nr:hypothetical protein RRG08_037335 [Elysia crispata]
MQPKPLQIEGRQIDKYRDRRLIDIKTDKPCPRQTRRLKPVEVFNDCERPGAYQAFSSALSPLSSAPRHPATSASVGATRITCAN